MKKFLVLTSLLQMTAICLCAPSPSETTRKHTNTTYDQRQVGKYNIHFNIKDVSIIAFSSDDIIDHIGDSDAYNDYYEYEDSEYTVSPITADLSGRPTTKKPNMTLTLQPSIAGLNLSSITTSTDSPHSETSNTPHTIVVIHEKPSTSHANITESSSASYQPDQIPVKVIVEPILKPKIRPVQSTKRKLSNRQANAKAEEDGNDDIITRPRRAQIRERIRSRRAQNRLSRNGNSIGCARGETSDGQGGCRNRVRRSGMSGFLGFIKQFLPQRDNE